MSKLLEEKRNELIKKSEDILGKAKTEERALTDEEAKEIENNRAEVDKIANTLRLEAQVRDMKPKEKKPEQNENEIQTREIKDLGITVDVAEIRAMEDYIRGEVLQNRATPVNMALSDNGAVIPTTVVRWIIRKVYDICPILDRSQKFNVKGKVQLPYYPADANVINVAYAEEFEDLTSSVGKFGSIELSGFLAGALTKISRSLINNAQIDIVGFVVDEMAYAIRRWIEHECLIGTTGKVTGLSNLKNGITAASATAITAEEVVKLHDSIKDEFQRNAIWIMSPATRTALRLLKSNTGYFLLNDDISTPFGTSILGKPVYVSDNMPDIAGGKAVIYYGDMHGLATKFSEDINIQVLREKFATQHAVGVVGWLEFDAKVVDEQQIAKLTMKSA